jgi:hypothetical protein
VHRVPDSHWWVCTTDVAVLSLRVSVSSPDGEAVETVGPTEYGRSRRKWSGARIADRKGQIMRAFLEVWRCRRSFSSRNVLTLFVPVVLATTSLAVATTAPCACRILIRVGARNEPVLVNQSPEHLVTS